MGSKETFEYFNLGARGLPVRLAYLAGGIDFEDKRYEFGEWPGRKPSTPLGQLPVLTSDGTEFTQSAGLLRYVGGSAVLYPAAGTKDQLLVEDVLETVSEIWGKVPAIDKHQEYLDGRVAKALGHIEKLVTTISGEDAKFVLGDKLSVADLFLYAYIDFFGSGFFDNISAKDYEKYELVQRICQSVKEHDKFKKFFAAGKC